MPPHRNFDPLRRSRRLSLQEPTRYDDDGFQVLHESDLVDSSVPPPVPPPPPPPPPSSHSRPAPYNRSHSKKKKDGHISRPRNSFICFRSYWCQRNCDPNRKYDHRQVSRIAAVAWKHLTDEDKLPFLLEADEEKRLHAIKYPDYHYTPGARQRKPRKKPVRRDSRAEKVKCDGIVHQLFLEKSTPPVPVPKVESTTPELIPSKALPEMPSPAAPDEMMDDKLAYPDLVDEELVYPDDEFVPTEQIPPLQLSPPAEVPNEPSLAQLNFNYGEERPSFIFNAPHLQLGLPGPIMPFKLEEEPSVSMFTAPPSPRPLDELAVDFRIQKALYGHDDDDVYTQLWESYMN